MCKSFFKVCRSLQRKLQSPLQAKQMIVYDDEEDMSSIPELPPHMPGGGGVMCGCGGRGVKDDEVRHSPPTSPWRTCACAWMGAWVLTAAPRRDPSGLSLFSGLKRSDRTRHRSLRRRGTTSSKPLHMAAPKTAAAHTTTTTNKSRRLMIGGQRCGRRITRSSFWWNGLF